MKRFSESLPVDLSLPPFSICSHQPSGKDANAARAGQYLRIPSEVHGWIYSNLSVRPSFVRRPEGAPHRSPVAPRNHFISNDWKYDNSVKNVSRSYLGEYFDN